MHLPEARQSPTPEGRSDAPTFSLDRPRRIALSGPAVPGRMCRTDVCLTVDSRELARPATFSVQGFLHGISRDTDSAIVSALRARHWRLSDERTYDLARAQGAKITWIISDSWWRETCRRGSRACPIPPWEDWARYESFVRDLVRRSITSNRPVDFWDIVNEPGTPETGSGSVPLYLEQFRRAHNVIRSVDAGAKLVGPSIPSFADDPYPVRGYRTRVSDLDLRTFVEYVDSAQIRFDALSWHEHTSDAREANPVRSPADLVDHIARARRVVSEWKSVGPMGIHVNEYVLAESRRIPGWNVGWIAALERAHVDAAMRTCWMEEDAGRSPYPGCRYGVLDGLLERDARTTRPVYWVHRKYAEMTGTGATIVTNRRLSVYATRDDGKRKMRVLLGRHEHCTRMTNPGCVDVQSADPIDIDIEIHFPYDATSAQLTIDRIPNQRESLIRPSRLAAGPIELNHGWFTVHLRKVADGDALAFTVETG